MSSQRRLQICIECDEQTVCRVDVFDWSNAKINRCFTTVVAHRFLPHLFYLYFWFFFPFLIDFRSVCTVSMTECLFFVGHFISTCCWYFGHSIRLHIHTSIVVYTKFLIHYVYSPSIEAWIRQQPNNNIKIALFKLNKQTPNMFRSTIFLCIYIRKRRDSILNLIFMCIMRCWGKKTRNSPTHMHTLACCCLIRSV